MPPKLPKSSEQTFETSIERLEEIVEEMEGEKLPLEKLLELYEEGTKLMKVCQEKLETAEKRIEIITRNSAGKAQLAEFDPSAAPLLTSPSPSLQSPARTAPPDPEEVCLF